MSYSRYALADLHVHSPADAQHRYGALAGNGPSEESSRTIIQAHVNAGVSVIALTDHNDLSWYPSLKAAGDELGVFVFPGLEVNVGGCHLILLWDRTDQGFDSAHKFLESQWLPSEPKLNKDRTPTPIPRGQVLEVAEVGRDYQALVFAPHATQSKIGFFASGVCSNRGSIVSSGLITAYDVVGNPGAAVLTNPSAEFGAMKPPWFMSGDVRSLDDVGKRAVYLKLGPVPTLEGIRQAFLVPEHRVRFQEAQKAKWGTTKHIEFTKEVSPSWSRLTRITISGGFHDGLNFECAPGLNAIIGGKGTGKSTLVEIVRHVLGLDEPTDQTLIGNRKQNFRANAQAKVEFVDSANVEYQVSRSGDSSAPVLSRDGKDVPFSPDRRLQVQVFGQRELQELGANTPLLTNFLAARSQTEWQDALNSERDLQQELVDSGSELSKLDSDIVKLSDDETELHDIKDKLKVAESRGVTALIEKSKKTTRLDEDVKAAIAWPTNVLSGLAALRGTLPAPQFPEDELTVDAPAGALVQLSQGVTNAINSVEGECASANASLAGYTTTWEGKHAELRSTINAQLADSGLSDPEELVKAQEQVAKLEKAIANLPKKRARQSELKDQRQKALNDLADARRLKSRLVEEAARQLSESVGSRVRVRTEPLGDKSKLRQMLEASLKGQKVPSAQLDKLEEVPPLQLANSIRDGGAALQALGCSGTTTSKLIALPQATIRQIEEIETPDRVVVEIELGAGSSDNWVPVTEVSPGQRSTALLALALASGEGPLIIDQPEDDLDNRYIYDEVVKILAATCERRQVFVVTHNANIPILGDAELILALDARADRSTVIACGGIEDPEVAESARQILEGGDEAFSSRYQRYLASKTPS